MRLLIFLYLSDFRPQVSILLLARHFLAGLHCRAGTWVSTCIPKKNPSEIRESSPIVFMRCLQVSADLRGFGTQPSIHGPTSDGEPRSHKNGRASIYQRLTNPMDSRGPPPFNIRQEILIFLYKTGGVHSASLGNIALSQPAKSHARLAQNAPRLEFQNLLTAPRTLIVKIQTFSPLPRVGVDSFIHLGYPFLSRLSYSGAGF